MAQTTDTDCGPTSMTILLQYYKESHVSPSVQALVDAGFGTLPVRIEHWLQENNITFRKVRTEHELISALRGGYPIMALLNISRGPFRAFHYVVIVGAEIKNQQPVQFFIHDGKHPYAGIDVDRFLRQWKRANSWAIILTHQKPDARAMK